MLLLAGKPDHGRLAVADRLVRRKQAARDGADFAPDRFACLRQRRQILHIAAGERILHDRYHGGFAQRRLRATAGFAPHLVDETQYSLDIHVRLILLPPQPVLPPEWLP